MPKNVLIKSALLFAFCSLSACREEIVHKLSEEQANSLITRLAQVDIEARKISEPDGKWAISVPSKESLEALQQLENSKLFRQQSEASQQSAGILSSREDQRLRFERSLSRELETSLISLPGVLQARVHLNLPPIDPLFGKAMDKQFQSSASVLLICEKTFTHSLDQIAALVGGAAGIEVTQVRVLISSALERRTQIEQQNSPAQGSIFSTILELSPKNLLRGALLTGIFGILLLAWLAFYAGRKTV